MPIPMRQNMRVGLHLFKQRLKGRTHFPFIVEIEPLFACNLACPGCGKIQYPTDILRRRLSVSDVVNAVEQPPPAKLPTDVENPPATHP